MGLTFPFNDEDEDDGYNGESFTNTLPLCTHPLKTMLGKGRRYRSLSLFTQSCKLTLTLWKTMVAATFLVEPRRASLSLDQELEVVPPAEEYDLVY